MDSQSKFQNTWTVLFTLRLGAFVWSRLTDVSTSRAQTENQIKIFVFFAGFQVFFLKAVIQQHEAQASVMKISYLFLYGFQCQLLSQQKTLNTLN